MVQPTWSYAMKAETLSWEDTHMPIEAVNRMNPGQPQVTLGGGAIASCSKKQDCIAMLTMEAMSHVA